MDAEATMMEAVLAGDIEQVRPRISESPASAGARDGQGVSAIMQALYRGRRDVAEVLRAAHEAPDIFEAASLGDIARLSELLRKDRGLAHAWSSDGFTALHFAAFFAQEQAARILLESGAAAGAVARNGMQVTPLHSAAAARQSEMVRLLLESGAAVDARQQGGWTALHAAAQHGDVRIVEILLEHGADAGATNDAGLRPADLARQKGHEEAASLLSSSRTPRA